MQHTYIQDQESLVLYCQQIKKAEILAIDTEFVRTRTLYPNLGLIQVYDGNELALIDPVAIEDLSSFWQVLADENVCKVIHSCSEDLEVFMHSGNCKPANMIDSQIMMAFLGHGLSMGYAAMIKHFLDIDVDKSESRTDWMKRPLSENQLRYAAADVLYLHQISQDLIDQVIKAGRLEQVKAESQFQIEKKFTPIVPENLYLDFKQAWRLSPPQLVLLQHLLMWRYEQAKKRNLPLSFVAKDHTLLILAQRNPKSTGAMLAHEGVEVLDVRHKGKAMLNVLEQANKIESDKFPLPISRLDNHQGYKQIYKDLRNKIIELAKEQDLDVQVVAGKRQINQFLSWFWKLSPKYNSTESVEILNGWRGELFGKALMDFADKGFS